MIIHMNTMSNSDVHVCHCYTTIIHSLLIIIYSDGSCTWKIHVRSVYCTVLCIPSANDIIVCASLDFHSDKASNMQTSLHTSLHAAIMMKTPCQKCTYSASADYAVSELPMFALHAACIISTRQLWHVKRQGTWYSTDTRIIHGPKVQTCASEGKLKPPIPLMIESHTMS